MAVDVHVYPWISTEMYLASFFSNLQNKVGSGDWVQGYDVAVPAALLST